MHACDRELTRLEMMVNLKNRVAYKMETETENCLDQKLILCLYSSCCSCSSSCGGRSALLLQLMMMLLRSILINN